MLAGLRLFPPSALGTSTSTAAFAMVGAGHNHYRRAYRGKRIES